MIKYKLLNIYNNPTRITIDESAKEDFKKIMNWTEEEWNKFTIEEK